MRILLFLFALNAFNLSAQQTTSQEVDETTNKLRRLARVHDMVHKLPYKEEYIRGTILAEIQGNRKKVAPHFPERHEIPQGAKPIEIAKNWINNYPQEYVDYITYVESVLRKYTINK